MTVASFSWFVAVVSENTNSDGYYLDDMSYSTKTTNTSCKTVSCDSSICYNLIFNFEKTVFIWKSFGATNIYSGISDCNIIC